MDMSKYSGSSFIKVDDVRNGPVRKRIGAVTLGKWDKPNLVFEDGDVLSVNATNNRTLRRAYGNESDGWIGKEIELSLGEIKFQGEPREAVLVRPILPPIKKAKTPEPEQKPDYNDELPEWLTT